MFVGNRTVRRSENPLGKHERVAPLGVQQFSEQAYHGFRFQVGRRTLGLTVKRVTYSVAIREMDGPDSGYLTDLPNLEAAHDAARAWIDQRLEANETSSRKVWETRLAQVQARLQRPATGDATTQAE